MNEISISHNTNETKDKSKKIFASGVSASKKGKPFLQVKSYGNWDCQGIVYVDHLGKAQTSTLLVVKLMQCQSSCSISFYSQNLLAARNFIETNAYFVG